MRNKKQPEVLELLNDFIEEYMPVAAGLSENTIRLYKTSFRLLMIFFYEMRDIDAERITFHDLDYETIQSFLDWLETERKCSVATRNIRLAALSSFASYAQNRNLDAALIFLNSVRKTPVKKVATSPRIFFTRDEVSVLLRMPDTASTIGLRDATLLSLMYATGARAQEICDLKVRDIFFEKDVTKITLTGKGKKSRRICIARPCAEMLKRYLVWQKIEQQPNRYVFSSRTHKHMTVSCIEALYKKYLREAKKQNPSLFREKHYSPHTMRHTCAMHMLEAGVPIMSIKNFLGHAYVMTTERYAELSQSTVDKQIKAWNQRWFQDTASTAEPMERKCNIPNFLK